MSSSLYASSLAPGLQEQLDARSFEVMGEQATRPSPPTTARPGHVVLSIVTDSGTPAEIQVPADHELLPDLLARRATRVRDVAPGVVLPEPVPHPSTPTSALVEKLRPVYPSTEETQ